MRCSQTETASNADGQQPANQDEKTQVNCAEQNHLPVADSGERTAEDCHPSTPNTNNSPEGAAQVLCSSPRPPSPTNHTPSLLDALSSPLQRDRIPTVTDATRYDREEKMIQDQYKAQALDEIPLSQPPDSNRRRRRQRQVKPTFDRNLCSCGQPGYGLMVRRPLLCGQALINFAAAIGIVQYRCRVCGRQYHKDCVVDEGHTFGKPLYSTAQSSSVRGTS